MLHVLGRGMQACVTFDKQASAVRFCAQYDSTEMLGVPIRLYLDPCGRRTAQSADALPHPETPNSNSVSFPSAASAHGLQVDL